MSMPNGLQAALGAWSGTTELYMPGEATRAVASTAVVAAAAQGQFGSISYTWSYDGQPQDGMLLIGQSGEQGELNVVWIDSWHMGDKLMHCRGDLEADGVLSVRGSYQVEQSPDWGWKIVLRPEREHLRITMYNVSPEGEEYLGVEAEYTRVTTTAQDVGKDA